MNKVEDFIANRRMERSGFEHQLIRSKSVSKMTTNEKEGIKR